MAEESRLSGINWHKTFPFTNLFRSFRIAIQPSKLALGLVALLCLYLGGRFLDAVWSVQSRAVPGEPALFAKAEGRSVDFILARQDSRRQIEEAYAQELFSLGVVKDEEQARAAAQQANLTDQAKSRILAIRAERVKHARTTLRDALATNAKLTKDNQQARRDRKAYAAYNDKVKAAYDDALTAMKPVEQVRGSGLFHEEFKYETAQVVGVVWGVASGNWLGGLHGDAPQGVVKSVFNFFTVGPMWLMWHHTLFFIVYGLLFLVVWAIFGGAIARIAAVHVARDQKLSVRAALAFSGSKFLSFVSAPLIPIIIVLLVGLLPLVAGALSSIPYVGPAFYLLMGALFVILLAAGFVMTLVLIGLVGGLNLMYPTIAVEGSDSFDAISRSFSYVYARPWRMLWYTAVAVVYGALTYLFVRLFIYLMLALTHRFVSAGMFAMAPSTESLWPLMWPGPGAAGTLSYRPVWLSLRWDQAVAAFFVAFWVYLLLSVLGAFAISFYFTSNTIIYYLMRHQVDATEMDDVYLEQSDEDFGESAPVSESSIEPLPPAAAEDAGTMTAGDDAPPADQQ